MTDWTQTLLTTTDALAFARRCLAKGGLRISHHAWERLNERDFDVTDVMKVLKSGCIYKPPEFDIKHGNWKYKVEGQAVDDRELILIVCFHPDPTTIVITIFPGDA